MKKALARLALFLGVPAIALGVGMATAMPALATSQGPMCTAFGANLCIRVDSTLLGTQVLTGNGPGRTMLWDGFGIGTTGTLCLKANPDRCLGLNAGSGNVRLKHQTDSGTSWKKVQAPATFYYVSVRYGTYMTGFDCVGCILAAGPHPFPGGGEQQWVGPA